MPWSGASSRFLACPIRPVCSSRALSCTTQCSSLSWRRHFLAYTGARCSFLAFPILSVPALHAVLVCPPFSSPVVSCSVFGSPVFLCLDIECRVTSCPVVAWWIVLMWRIVSCYTVLSCLALLALYCHVLPRFVIVRDFLSCPRLPCSALYCCAQQGVQSCSVHSNRAM